MFEFLGVTVLVVVMAGLIWEIARRRARAEQAQEELRPYAMLGENMEGVAHDSRKLLRAARENLERLEHQPDVDPQKLAAMARAQVKQAESFLFALGTPRIRSWSWTRWASCGWWPPCCPGAGASTPRAWTGPSTWWAGPRRWPGSSPT